MNKKTMAIIKREIYRLPQLLIGKGTPIKVEAGKVLNILIDFTGNISASVTITPWGEQHVWKEFN